ncbi:glycoside hydrolase family 2 protein [Rathayibacter sp. VKM Ac-2803]|uniref:glycoside hydrolase family 2 protein n=1 Tax=Rathayibacter sp. VKM Ac-2803 TaxID=2609256 RepID=UPI00135BC905|nr:glycoside hydrolase family 2 protein [Rathayibacter sp. VKM Ac-2803]MWV48519.1 glycoside hydrolase family 2 protein [Rathayibacter sp. VKM Ac-2803]
MTTSVRPTTVRPTTVRLHEGWSVEPLPGRLVPRAVAAAGPIAAVVPGTVHTDLLAGGLIEDPYIGTNEKLQEWVGSTSWRYTTTFTASADGADRADLVFEGLDTIATVRLNGEVVLESRNQHRSYRVPVQGRLVDGENTLEVVFAAPVPAADRASLELEYRPHVNHHPFNAIRKSACSFGWDWGLDTSTSGIWRPVLLQSWSTARIAETIVSADVDGNDGVVDLRVAVDSVTSDALEVVASVGGTTLRADVVDGEARLRLAVADVQRWWPRGYGEQTLYDLAISLEAGGEVLDERTKRIGFRTVRADTTPDDAGTPFVLIVNDRPVYVKGVNWIPDDTFPHRIDAERYRARLTQAADANINLIRVWGGGIFESDDFYDAADELGLLTWQDFLLACAAYAEEEPLFSEIVAESREAVIRLGSHPSLVILNGNNENIWGRVEWGWDSRLEGRTWGEGYYYDVFPGLVDELAPHVVYTPGSPFSPDRSQHPNDALNGTTHLWEHWNREDYPRYREVRPRFVSEFGWQGPPTWATLSEAMPDEPLTPESPSMLVHQKAMEGNVKLTDGLVAHLPLPNTMPEWHWAMGLNQALAIRTALDWFRSLQPHNTGAIVWQLNDNWPVVSWAAVDGYGRKKPLWYAIRAAFADRVVTVQPEGGRLEASLSNDTDVDWTGTLRASRRSFDNEVLSETSATLEVPARTTIRVPLDLGAPADAAAELLVAEFGGERGLWFFAEFRDSALRSPSSAEASLETEAHAVDGGVDVTVTARSLVRELALLADVAAPDAEVDDMLVTLLPGESVTFHVRTASGVAPEAFTAPEVLRSANTLLAAVTA